MEINTNNYDTFKIGGQNTGGVGIRQSKDNPNIWQIVVQGHVDHSVTFSGFYSFAVPVKKDELKKFLETALKDLETGLIKLESK